MSRLSTHWLERVVCPSRSTHARTSVRLRVYRSQSIISFVTPPLRLYLTHDLAVYVNLSDYLSRSHARARDLIYPMPTSPSFSRDFAPSIIFSALFISAFSPFGIAATRESQTRIFQPRESEHLSFAKKRKTWKIVRISFVFSFLYLPSPASASWNTKGKRCTSDSDDTVKS